MDSRGQGTYTCHAVWAPRLHCPRTSGAHFSRLLRHGVAQLQKVGKGRRRGHHDSNDIGTKSLLACRDQPDEKCLSPYCLVDELCVKKAFLKVHAITENAPSRIYSACYMGIRARSKGVPSIRPSLSAPVPCIQDRPALLRSSPATGHARIQRCGTRF